MLREAFERADGDRIRLQAISSTLLGRLLAINDTIGGAVRASIKDGIEATNAAKTEDELAKEKDLDKAASEVQAILQRVDQPNLPVPRESGVGSPAIPGIDWSKLPRGKIG
jgi:hypothetical protein